MSKNRKVKNTSNLYTLQAPKGVNDIHHPSECDSLPLVNDIHHPSEYSSPEQNHLTKSIRTISINNNNKGTTSPSKNLKPKQQTNDVVVDLLSQKRIKTTTATINKWLKLANEETVISAIHEVLKRPDIQNVIGYITRMLEQGYTSPQTTIHKTAKVTRGNLPEWIVKQLESVDQATVAEGKLSEEQKQQAIELLRQLDEIGES